jgi:hypothetical protein
MTPDTSSKGESVRLAVAVVGLILLGGVVWSAPVEHAPIPVAGRVGDPEVICDQRAIARDLGIRVPELERYDCRPEDIP